MLTDELLISIIKRLDERAKESIEAQGNIFDLLSPQELGYLLRVMNANSDTFMGIDDLEKIILNLLDK
ncbi:MAG: hypothetical protein K2J47_03700 [Ruminococcus sp.]|nr:hypothetical protein [Ruminococcus sp.]